MLALHCRSRQVIVANEIFDDTDMIVGFPIVSEKTSRRIAPQFLGRPLKACPIEGQAFKSETWEKKRQGQEKRRARFSRVATLLKLRGREKKEKEREERTQIR